MTKQASAFKSIGFFMLGILVFFGFRWGFYEPYVIPSGSMIPSLLINDHIVVKKYEYGLRWPFTDSWIYGPYTPQRGDVVVFRSVKDSEFFMVKRVVGLPGDKIKVTDKGELIINDAQVEREEVKISDLGLDNVDIRRSPESTLFLNEHFENDSHIIMMDRSHYDLQESFEVPVGELFVMGDNRHSSQDSRFWGTLPVENLLGRATHVWLSCRQGVRTQQILCHPRHIRWQRMFYKIQ